MRTHHENQPRPRHKTALHTITIAIVIIIASIAVLHSDVEVFKFILIVPRLLYLLFPGKGGANEKKHCDLIVQTENDFDL